MDTSLTQTHKQQIIKEHLSGIPVRKLASHYKIGVSTIYQWLRNEKSVEPQQTKLINIMGLIVNTSIELKINGYQITIDEENLPMLLKGLTK